MFTFTDYEALLVMAGSDHAWAGYGTKDSRVVAALTVIMREHQDNVCALCNESMAGEDVAMCHIIGAVGPDGKRRGYVPGNLLLGHAACNADDNMAGLADVPFGSILRRDLIMTEWPSGLARMGQAIREANLAERETAQARRRMARGL